MKTSPSRDKRKCRIKIPKLCSHSLTHSTLGQFAETPQPQQSTTTESFCTTFTMTRTVATDMR